MLSQSRQLIAEEAARLLYEEGYRDYQVAKLKAAQRLGCAHDKSSQPANLEIHQAILSRIQLLASDKEKDHLSLLRKIAIEAMEFLHPYRPLLVGAVLDGTAGLYSAVTLHLFSNTPEEVMFFLDDQRIPYQSQQRRMKVRGKQEYYPMLRFFADDIEVELVLFDRDIKHAPVSNITGKSMKRVDVEGARDLLLNPD